MAVDAQALTALADELFVDSDNKKFVRKLLKKGDIRGAQLYLLGAIDAAYEFGGFDFPQAGRYCERLGLKGEESARVEYKYELTPS